MFGYDLKDYDELFEEKLGLLLELNKTERITWSGKYRPELRNMKIFPRPIDNILPIWRAVGGPPALSKRETRCANDDYNPVAQQ